MVVPQKSFPYCMGASNLVLYFLAWGFPGSAGKESTYNAGDLGSTSELGRSPGEGKGYPLYSGLENSMVCIVHGVTKSQTRLSDFHFHFLCYKNKLSILILKLDCLFLSCLSQYWQN